MANIINGSDASWVGVSDEKGRRIAEFKGKHHGILQKEMHANVKLFIAAPKMIDILITISEYANATDEMPPRMKEKLFRAIKKATS